MGKPRKATRRNRKSQSRSKQPRNRLAQFEQLEERKVLTAILPGDAFSANLNLAAGQVEFIDLTLNSALDLDDGDTLVIDTLGSSLTTNNDTELGLYDDTGLVLGINDDIDAAGGNFLSQLGFPADLTTGQTSLTTLPSGDFTIAAGAWDTTFASGLDGNGDPNATSTSTYSGPVQVNVVLQQNNFGTLVSGTTETDTDPLIAEEVKFFRFELDSDVTAANGASLVIDTLGSDLTLGQFFEDDTEIGLYDDSGNFIVENDDINGLSTSELSFGDGGADGDLTAGTYFLAAGSYDTTFGANFDATSDSVATGDIQVNLNLTVPTVDPLLVTTIDDTEVAGDGETSLREAIEFANTNPGADTITFDTAGVFATQQTITLTNGQLTIEDDVMIAGPGSDLLSVSGNSQNRVFLVEEGGGSLLTVDLVGMTVRDGVASDLGGGAGIFNFGALTITDVSIESNNAGTDNGGGIFNVGELDVINSRLTGNRALDGGAIFGAVGSVDVRGSTLSNNFAQETDPATSFLAGKGGAIRVTGGALDVVSSTINNNGSYEEGGGISVASDAPFTLRNSTVSGNDAIGVAGQVVAVGGGISAYDHGSTMTIENSTIIGNYARNDAGGVRMMFNSPDTTINNTVITNNAAMASANVFGEFAANYTLIGSLDGGATITNNTNSNLLNIDAMVDQTLADNGGPTMTHALLPGSPAINSGDPSAVAGVGGVPEFDQRGAGFSRVVLDRMDIGAIEEVNPLRAVDDVVTGTVGVPLGVDILSNDIGAIVTIGPVTGLPPGLGIGGDGMGNTLFGTPTTAGTFTFTYFVTLGDGTRDEADVVVTIEPANSIACDFDGDMVCDGNDIDALQANIVTGPADPGTYDLTNDGMVTIADRNEWLVQAGAENLGAGRVYLLGDANLDGSVDVTDFNAWNGSKFSANSAWTSGDFNADGSVDVTDFNAWNGNKFQSVDSAGSVVVTNQRPQVGLPSELGSDLGFDLDTDSDRGREELDLLDAVFGDWA